MSAAMLICNANAVKTVRRFIALRLVDNKNAIANKVTMPMMLMNGCILIALLEKKRSRYGPFFWMGIITIELVMNCLRNKCALAKELDAGQEGVITFDRHQCNENHNRYWR